MKATPAKPATSPTNDPDIKPCNIFTAKANITYSIEPARELYLASGDSNVQDNTIYHADKVNFSHKIDFPPEKEHMRYVQANDGRITFVHG